MPERIRLQRTKGWRKPPNAVVVARPTFWGNPYSITTVPPMWPKNQPWDRAAAAGCFEIMVTGGWRLRRPPGFQIMERAMVELEGKDLACWCPLDEPCHGDFLLRIANGTPWGVLASERGAA